MEQEKQKKEWITPQVEVISSYSIKSGNTPGVSESSAVHTIGGKDKTATPQMS